MQPIFKEKEEKGVYIATLDFTTDKGILINCTLEMGVKNIKDAEIERYINLCLPLDAIDLHIKQFIENRKTDALKDLYNDFNKRVDYENEFGHLRCNI